MQVSILVVLDDALVPLYRNIYQSYKVVSILVVLDDALVHHDYQALSDYVIKSQSLLCWTML